MINNKQLREAVIKPSLSKIGLYSPDGEELLVATAAQETLGGTFLVQVDKKGNLFYAGGLGIYQMEKRSHDGLWVTKLRDKEKPDTHSALGQTILDACGFAVVPSAAEMICNLAYATMMARVFYTQFSDPLPKATDIEGIWAYYKARWNTEKGAATRYAFISNYKKYCA